MELKLHATFADLPEMLAFMAKFYDSPAESPKLDQILERINNMANTQVADFIASTRGSLASLNAEQARMVSALDQLLAQRNEMLTALDAIPARIQAAVDAAMAEGVDETQIAALTELGAAVAGEVAEARTEAERLEAVVRPVTQPTPDPAPQPVPEPAPTDGTTPVVDAGGDTTGGGQPAPTPAG